jgi:hypothetical protein
MRALAKRPEDRFGSVQEFARAASAMALRRSRQYPQQLCARAFEDDPKKSRIATPAELHTDDPLPPPHDLAPPENQPSSRLESRRCPAKATARRPVAVPPPIGRATRRPWLSGGGVLALPLLIATDYIAAGGGMPLSSSAPSAASASAAATPAGAAGGAVTADACAVRYGKNRIAQANPTCKAGLPASTPISTAIREQQHDRPAVQGAGLPAARRLIRRRGA